jgi:GTP-binding protein
MTIDAVFVRSAASAEDLPHDGLPELAFVGRSNVGKSSLINALVRQRIARTSAAPGKTRLANIYRVVRGGGSPFYLVDLPGYGYSRGGAGAARDFEELTRGYFGRADLSALLLVDARHPGLESDVGAWRWVRQTVERCAVAATKIDKLARGERIRVLRELESVLETSVLPVSAVTGEGLDELWTLIERLPSNRRPPLLNSSSPPPKATARPPRPHRKNWSSRRSRT